MRLLRPYNPLVFPGNRLPGFDPTHPAGNKCLFSGVASPGGSFINLLVGAFGSVVNGTAPVLPTYIIDGIVGPITTFCTAGQSVRTSYVEFSGQNPVNTKLCTIACIVHNTLGAGPVFCSNLNNSGGAAGTDLRGNPLAIHYPGTGGYTAGLSFPTGYSFVAASANAAVGVANFVVLNLTTGTVQSQQVTGGAVNPLAPDGNYTIGNYANGGVPSGEFFGSIAAVSYSAVTLTMTQLLAWAADPWSFRYPPNQRNLMFSGLSAPSIGLTLSPATMIQM